MEVLAEVVRSGLVESWHRGVAVRVDAAGEVVWSMGDPGTVVFPRSANKPIQALGMVHHHQFPVAERLGPHAGDRLCQPFG